MNDFQIFILAWVLTWGLTGIAWAINNIAKAEQDKIAYWREPEPDDPEDAWKNADDDDDEPTDSRLNLN